MMDAEAVARELFDAVGEEITPAKLERVIKRMRKRDLWHMATSLKNSSLARAIRVIEKSLLSGGRIRRERHNLSWKFFARDATGQEVCFASLDFYHPQSFEDFSKRHLMKVHRPDMVDMQMLKAACGTFK